VTWSVRDALSSAAGRLTAAGVESARTDAEVLLAWVLGTPRGGLHALTHLDDSDAAAFWRAVGRRESREPLQHITGRAPFRYVDLEVGRGVFLPRPETELLAGAAIEELSALVAAGHAHPLAVDLCTGSGAVAVSMAKEVPASSVIAVELSCEAAAYAERNATGLAVEVRCGDMADAVDDLAGRVAVVTANPPYIPLSAYESVAVEAREYDPPVALWSGQDGLDAIRTVADVAARLLVDGGLVLCEHADVQGESAPALFAALPEWTAVRDMRDLSQRPRFVSARRVPRSSGEAGTITS
jgi:release factor glutamine methyltransferase